MSVPQRGTDQNGELKKEEEKTHSCSHCVGTRWKWPSAYGSTQVEPASNLRDDSESAKHNEGHREHGTKDAHAAMHGGARGGDERCLRQKQEEPRNCHDGVQCHERRQRKW